MQSVIISFLYRLFISFKSVFVKTGTYKLFDRIYGAFSNAWRDSAIVNLLSKNADGGAFAQNSVLYKLLRFPFKIAEAVNKHLGNYARYVIDKSFIVHIFRIFLNNILALNTRFGGVMLLACGMTYAAARFALGAGISKAGLIIAAVGVVLCVFNRNVTAFLETSAVVRFVEKTLGFELRYDFFKKTLTSGRGRIVIAALAGAAAGAVGSVNILLAPLLICGAFGMSLVLYAPITGVFFAVFAAPFVPTMVLAALCILTLGSLFIKGISTPYFKWRFDGMGLALAFLLLIFLISSITSFAPVNSLTVWCMYFVFMGFYFVIINSVKSRRQVVGLLRVFVLAGALVALYGVLQYVFGWNTSNAWIDEEMFENDTMRVYSTLENPNVLGEYLLLVLPISAVFMCRHKCAELSKWAYAAVTAILFLCLILTQSRGCWLGFMLAAVIFVTFTNGRLWGLVPIALAIVPFIIPQTIVDRLLSIGNMEDSSTSYRVFIWFGTIAMLKDFFIGGIGMGEKAFNSVYPFYSYNAIIAPHSHNLYLQLVTESGVAALAVFIACMVIFIRRMASMYNGGEKTSEGSMLAVGFISGVAGFLLQSMFDYTFYNYRVMAMFFMFLAMGMAYKYVTRGKENV